MGGAAPRRCREQNVVIALVTSYEQTIKIEYHLRSEDFTSYVSFVTAFWGRDLVLILWKELRFALCPAILLTR